MGTSSKCIFKVRKKSRERKGTAAVLGIYKSQSALKIAANSCVLYFYYQLPFYLSCKPFV